MSDEQRRITALMRRVRREGDLPPSSEIVSEAFVELGLQPGAVEPAEILANFNDRLREVWEATLPILERYEERSYAEGIPRELLADYPTEFTAAETRAESAGFRAGVLHLFASWYPLLRRCFLSVSQSRMTRGGKDFELQIEGLLDRGGIPYTRQEREHRTDLILPSQDLYLTNRNVAAIVSVKRTLRERWAEVAQELFALRSPNVFLFTADEKVTANHVQRLKDYNIYLVVWDAVKERRFMSEPLVLGYTEWSTERLPILQANWPQSSPHVVPASRTPAKGRLL